MARYNEILVGRYNRFIQKLLSMKGPATMPQVASEMQPVIAFLNGADNRYLEGYDRFGGGTAVTGVALNVSGVRLRNPTGSNVIACIEKLAVSVGTSTQVNFTMDKGLTDLTNISANTTRLDSRGRSNTGLVLSNQATTAAIGGTVFFSAQLLNTIGPYDLIVDEDQALPLLPGDVLAIITNAVQITLTVGLLWRERALEDSERA